jgi:hypothetical protein
MLRPTALLLLLFSVACCALPPSRQNDDRDVIQTAMLSLFTREPWHSSDWRPKRHVVLRPKYGSATRKPFAAQLREAKERSQRDIDYINRALPDRKTKSAEKITLQKELLRAQNEFKVFAEIQRHMLDGPPYTPEALKQPDSLSWDKRIVVSEKSNWYGMFRNPNADKSLEEHTIYATAEPPSYSTSGRYAILNLSIPWSIHSCDVYFFYERQGDKWIRKLVQSQFYV